MSSLELCDERKCLGGLGIEERTVSQHGAGHVQETVGHTAQSAWMGMTAFAQLSCESQDLTCRTVSDQVVFCTRKPSSKPAILAWPLSAWARRAVKPHSRFAVRRRRRACGPAGAPSHHSSCQSATRSDTVRQIKSKNLHLILREPIDRVSNMARPRLPTLSCDSQRCPRKKPSSNK